MARRGIRYSLNLPVSLTLAHKKFPARSESISLGGILLSSAFLVPEGSIVEVEVRIAQLPQPGVQLSARGKVLRVQPKATGDFAVAIVFERPIEFSLEDLKSGADLQLADPKLADSRLADSRLDSRLADSRFTSQKLADRQFKSPRFPALKNEFVSTRGLRVASTWFMET
jgi:hypothetical protein